MVNIKSQAAKHEITIIFVEPSGFENIATDANAWNKFMNEKAGVDIYDFTSFKHILSSYTTIKDK